MRSYFLSSLNSCHIFLSFQLTFFNISSSLLSFIKFLEFQSIVLPSCSQYSVAFKDPFTLIPEEINIESYSLTFLQGSNNTICNFLLICAQDYKFRSFILYSFNYNFFFGICCSFTTTHQSFLFFCPSFQFLFIILYYFCYFGFFFFTVRLLFVKFNLIVFDLTLFFFICQISSLVSLQNFISFFYLFYFCFFHYFQVFLLIFFLFFLCILFAFFIFLFLLLQENSTSTILTHQIV